MSTRAEVRRSSRLLLPILLVLVAGCTSGVGSPMPTATEPGPTADPSTPAPNEVPTLSPAPTNEGFPFAASAIFGYYESLGYTCGDARPSTIVEGFDVRACTLLDPDGRTRTIGVVTDTGGLVANGFASIKGTSDETFLDPTVALEPLSAFLGAMLGEAAGTDLVPWLAGHLGDAYAETTAGPITVATYTPTSEDRSTLTVEVGNDEYLDAPLASPSAIPSPTASG
jgi:hypothetical protein